MAGVPDKNRLHVLCNNGKLKQIKDLLSHDPKGTELINEPAGVFGFTPLHEAVSSRNADILQVLLRYGGQVDALSNGRYTPLHIAASIGDIECIKVLLDYSANLTLTDEFGKTPYATAQLNRRRRAARLLKTAEIKILAERYSPQLRAALEGLQRGRDVEEKCFEDALELAVAANNGKSVGYLVLTGARNVEQCMQAALLKPALNKTAVLLLLCHAAKINDKEMVDRICSKLNEENLCKEDDGKVLTRKYLPMELNNVMNMYKLKELRKAAKSVDMAFPVTIACSTGNFKVAKILLFEVFCNEQQEEADWHGLALSQVLPEWIKEKIHYKKLILSHNLLTSVQQEIIQMRNLLRLDLSKNNIETVPKEIFEMPLLRTLNLASNDIQYLPKVDAWSKAMKVLKLEENNLSFLDESIADSELETLNIADNNLSRVQLCICEIKTLQDLDLSRNKNITVLPPSLAKLSKLHYIGIKQMDQITDPHPTFRYSTSALLRHLKARLRNSVPYKTMKLMIVGLANRGKTTLMHRISKDFAFKDNHSTKGVDIRDITIEDVTFKCWDFAGQEEYYATHQCFLSQRSLYLLVWNIIEGEKGIKGLKPWLDNLQTRVPNSYVIIVGTHLDKAIKRGFDEEELNGRVHDMVRNYKEINCSKDMIVNITCSVERAHLDECRRRADGLRNLIRAVAKAITINGKPDGAKVLEEMIPSSYLSLASMITEKQAELTSKGQLPLLRKCQFEDLVSENSMKHPRDYLDPEDVDLATRFFNDIGLILHYDDPNQDLRDLYFISPSWLCDLMAKIVTVKEAHNFIRNGILEDRNIEHIIKNEKLPKDFYAKYLRLLARFQIACRIDEERILVPSKLPEEMPVKISAKNELKKTICRMHSFACIPQGFWSRFISRFLLYLNEMLNISHHTVREECPLDDEENEDEADVDGNGGDGSGIDGNGVDDNYGNERGIDKGGGNGNGGNELGVESAGGNGDDGDGSDGNGGGSNFSGTHGSGVDGSGVDGSGVDGSGVNSSGSETESQLSMTCEPNGNSNQENVVSVQGNEIHQGINDGESQNSRESQGDVPNGQPTLSSDDSVFLTDREQTGRNGKKQIQDASGIEDSQAQEPSGEGDVFSETEECDQIDKESLDNISMENGVDWQNRKNSREKKASQDGGVNAAFLINGLRFDDNANSRGVNCSPYHESREATPVSIGRYSSFSSNQSSSSCDRSHAQSSHASQPEDRFSPRSDRPGSVSSRDSYSTSDSGSFYGEDKARPWRLDEECIETPPVETQPLFYASSDVSDENFDEELDVSDLINKKRLVCWRKGVLLNHPKLFLSVSQIPSKGNRQLIETKVSKSQLGYRALAFTIDHIRTLIKEWFPGLEGTDGSEAYVCQYAPCPVCIDYGIEIPHEFDIRDCLKESFTSDCMVCVNNHTPQVVELKDLCPELLFMDLEKSLQLAQQELMFTEIDDNLLGQGQFGKVYRGTYLANSVAKSAAVKLFNFKVESNPDLTEALDHFYEVRQEAVVLSRVRRYPCIISFYGVAVRPKLCLAIELVTRGTLRDVLKDSEASMDRIVVYRIAQQAACAVSYLHSLGIIHRDLKSDNILMFSLQGDSDINIKLADFGTANFISPVGLKFFTGTPGFIAPEIFEYSKTDEYDVKVDVYSFAMVLYELVSRRRPFHHASSALEINNAVREGKRPRFYDLKKTRFCFLTLTDLMIMAWAQEAIKRPFSTDVTRQLKSPSFCLLYGKTPLRDVSTARQLCYIQSTNEIWVVCDDKSGACLVVIDLETSNIKQKFVPENKAFSRAKETFFNISSIFEVDKQHVAIVLRTTTDYVSIYSSERKKVVASYQIQDNYIRSAAVCNSHVIIGCEDGRFARIGKKDFLREKWKDKVSVVVNTKRSVSAVVTCESRVENGSEMKLLLSADKYIYKYPLAFDDPERVNYEKMSTSNEKYHVSQIDVSSDGQSAFVSRNLCPVINIYKVESIEVIADIDCAKKIQELIPNSDSYDQRVTCFCVNCDTLWVGLGSGHILIYDIGNPSNPSLITWLRPYKLEVRSIISCENLNGNRYVVTIGKELNPTALCYGQDGLCLLTGLFPVDFSDPALELKASSRKNKKKVVLQQNAAVIDKKMLLIWDGPNASVLKKVVKAF